MADNQFVQPPQDEYLFSRYNTPIETPAGDPQYRRVGSWLVADAAGADPALLEQKQVELADATRAQEAEAVLAAPSADAPTQLSTLAAETGTKDNAAATVGMATELASRDGETPPSPVASRQAWLARTSESQKRVIGVLEAFKVEQEEKARLTSGTSGALGAVADAASYTGQGVRAFVFPDFVVDLVNIASKYAPDFKASDYAAPKDLYNAVGRNLRNMPPEQAQAAAVEITKLIEAKSGTLFENNFEAKEMAQTLLEAVYDDKTNWRNVSQVLDLIGMVPVFGSGIKIAGKAAFAAETAVSAAVKGVGKVAKESVTEVVRAKPSEFSKAVSALDAKLAEVDRLIGRTPAVTPGTVSDAATMTQAGARQAVTTLGSETEQAVLAAAGTSPEQVAGSLVVHKLSQTLDELHRPYIEDIYLRPEVREQVAARVKAGLLDRFQTRLKDSTVTPVENGTAYEAVLGAADGRGYASREVAETLAKDYFRDAPFEVIENDARFFVKIKGIEPISYADIASDADLVQAGGFWRQMFGMNATFTQHYVNTVNSAVRGSNKATALAQKLVKPYSSLMSWSRTKVNRVLDEGESAGKEFTREELLSRGLSEKEWAAYDSVRRLAQRDLAMQNFNLRSRLVADGYREATVAGKPVMVRDGGDLPKGGKVVNMLTGEELSADAVSGLANKKVYTFFDSTEQGWTRGVLLNSDRIALRDLPRSIIRTVPGYMPRRYNYTHYVRERMPDGTTRAVAGSQGSANATKLIQELKAKNPNIIDEPFEASEISDLPSLFDDMQAMKEQGLVYNSHRKPNVIVGLDGKPKLTSVEASISQMMGRFGKNGGLSRWTDYMLHTLNKTYGDLGVNFGLGRKPTLVGGLRNASDKARYREAQTIWQHIQRVNGISALQLDPVIQGVRNSVADTIWSSPLRHVPGAKTIADNISGISTSITSGAKTAAFASYLGTNVVRNWFTQSSMIPTYLGARGGLKYAFTGGFTRDMFILQMSKIAPDFAKSLDAKLVADWRASGMDEAVDNHIFAIGTISDAREATSGVFGDVLGRSVNLLKGVGFDVGVRADKRAAFLSARNSFVDEFGRSPKNYEEWSKVVGRAESLALNQHSGDPLVLSNGALGILTQFQSQHVKMMGRLFGLERNFSVAERVRMQTVGLLTYGMDGYRIGDLVDKAEVESGEKWHPTVKELARQGIEGTIFNATLQAALDEEGERTSLDFSGTFGPANFAGPDLNLLTQFFGATVSSSQSQLPLLSSPAAFGLVGDIAEVAEFAYVIGGKITMPTEDKALAITTHFFRKFPLSNNLMKAMAAFNQGVKVDSRGLPVLETTRAEAIAAIASIPTTAEQEMNEAMGVLHGEYIEADEGGLYGALDNEAKHYAGILSEALIGMGNGERSVAEVRELVYNHAVAMKSVLGESEVRAYYNKLINEVEKRGVLKSERIVSSFINGISAGKIRANGELVPQLKTLNVPGMQSAINFVERQQEALANIKKYLESQ